MMRGDRAGDGDVDDVSDDDDDDDDIDNEGGDDNIGAGDTNDDGGGDVGNNGSDNGDNDDCNRNEVDVSNKDFSLDNVNAGEGKNKFDLGNVYSCCRDSNDDSGVSWVAEVDTNGGNHANCSGCNSNLDCVDDIYSGDGDDKEDGDVDDDNHIYSNTGNEPDCGDGKSKVNYRYSW